MQARGGACCRFARVFACVLVCLASGLRSAHGGFMLPIKRRDGGLHSRDLLQNATMPLHGAVRDYGCECICVSVTVYTFTCVCLITLAMHAYRYFYATLQLGTPAKSFEVIVDTGSTITYVPCAQCGDQCGSHHAVRSVQPLPASFVICKCYS